MGCGKINKAKMKRCVTAVKQSNIQRYGRQKYNPYAVCRSSIKTMNARRGMGLGKGSGYYNMMPNDALIHGLSAKGVKTYMVSGTGWLYDHTVRAKSEKEAKDKLDLALHGFVSNTEKMGGDVFVKKLNARGYDEPLEVIEEGNKRAEIYVDENPQDPREWDNLGTMVAFHREYNLGDKTDMKASQFESLEELRDYLIKEKDAKVVLPLVLLDHSGLSMKVGTSFSEDVGGWDTSKIGFIYVSADKIKKEYGKVTPATIKKAEENLRMEVETYDQYLSGDVYGYKIIEKQKVNIKGIRDFKGKLEQEKETDSCWGFYGLDAVKDEVKGLLKDKR